MKKISVRVRFVVEPDGDQFHAFAPDLKGVHAPGDTVDEALKGAREAACLYIVSLIKHKQPLPVGSVVEHHFNPVKSILSWAGSLVFGRRRQLVQVQELHIPAAA